MPIAPSSRIVFAKPAPFTLLTGALLLGLAMAGDGAAGYTHFEHFRIYIPIGLWLLFSAPTIAIVFHSVASRLQRPA